jgi:hypothetical protein
MRRITFLNTLYSWSFWLRIKFKRIDSCAFIRSINLINAAICSGNFKRGHLAHLSDARYTFWKLLLRSGDVTKLFLELRRSRIKNTLNSVLAVKLFLLSYLWAIANPKATGWSTLKRSAAHAISSSLKSPKI